jgi:hypothetical protein
MAPIYMVAAPNLLYLTLLYFIAIHTSLWLPSVYTSWVRPSHFPHFPHLHICRRPALSRFLSFPLVALSHASLCSTCWTKKRVGYPKTSRGTRLLLLPTIRGRATTPKSHNRLPSQTRPDLMMQKSSNRVKVVRAAPASGGGR